VATLNIAHRGSSATHPENTISAFLAAAEEGADMCELDVQATRDGAVVVIHDETVDRTTDGHGAVTQLSLAEIRGSMQVRNLVRNSRVSAFRLSTR